MQAQIDQLQEEVKKERAERDAAEQVNEDTARRLSQQRVKADSVTKERDAAKDDPR